MQPPVRFATTKDGVRIAYCTHGDGPPLVFVRGWISHLELYWEDPAYRSYFEALARHHLLVRYDVRGNGLSDRRVPEIDLDTLVLDLEAVVDELALKDIILYGATYGGLIAMAYVAKHPPRVAKLILDGTYTRGQEVASSERQQWILSMLRDSPDVALQRVLGYFTHPEPEQTRFRRASAQEFIDPTAAVQLYALGFAVDISALLPEIRVPTLVLHRRRSRAIPFRLGRDLAAHLPDARFVPLEGTAHLSWEGDASAALAALGDFLGVELEFAPAGSGVEGRAPMTILFTDMESSTALTQRFGDAKAQDLVRLHNVIVRDALEAQGGSEIKHTGDGIMASFTSVSQGVECAVAVQRAVAAHAEHHPAAPLRVRIGLNAGEPVAEEKDLFGTAVQLARRICDQAAPGQVLVSGVVRDLSAGKGFVFEDQGEEALRGFDEPVRLYGVRWQEEA